MSKSENLEIEFKKAAEKILKCNKNLDNDTLLKLYGLYKQSTIGDCNTDSPSFWMLRDKAKWDAWNNYKGFKKSNAQSTYINLVSEITK